MCAFSSNPNKRGKYNGDDAQTPRDPKRSYVRNGFDFLYAFCVHILALWVALGDAIIEFVASYVKVVDGIRFDEDSRDTPDVLVGFEDLKSDLLKTHNHCRSLHGCPPLTMSEMLTKSAQAWANKLDNKKMLLYSEIIGVGENIYFLNLNKPTIYSLGEHIAREWYSEIENYDYNTAEWQKDAFRGTQLLWKESREIGVGIAKDEETNDAYLVVHYWPPGNSNMPGEFQRNIPRRLQ